MTHDRARAIADDLSYIRTELETVLTAMVERVKRLEEEFYAFSAPNQEEEHGE